MAASEPRPGWRTTMYLETVDPEGLRVSDTTQNWYGKEDEESRLIHNTLYTCIVDAVSNIAKVFAAHKAISEGVDLDFIEAHHAIRSEIKERAHESR